MKLVQIRVEDDSIAKSLLISTVLDLSSSANPDEHF